MHPLIKSNQKAIAALCRQHGVQKLEVFGSILGSDFDASRSDVDVLVEFAPGADSARRFSDFLDLKQSLETLFVRPVDLIEPHTIVNRRLRHYIEQSKSVVYAAA